MKLRFCLVLGLVAILFLHPCNLLAQETKQSQQQDYFGFDSIEWKRISGRYERAQVRADIILRNGETISGQIVSIDSSKIILYPGYDIIIYPELEDDYIDIFFNDISRVKLRRNTKNYEAMIILGLAGGTAGLMGGAIAMWTEGTIWNISPFILGGAGTGVLAGRTIQQSPRRYNFEKNEQDESQVYSDLKKWAIFENNITYYSDFRNLVKNSELTARIFPEKRIKFTASINPGGKGINFTQTIEENIGDNYTVDYFTTRGFNPTISFSAAFKLRENIYLGAGWFNSRINGSYNYQFLDTIFYSIDPYRLRGYKIFAEYTPVSVDRYLGKRMEIITGAGIVFARSNQDISWYSINNEGAQTDYGRMDIYETKISGIFAKVHANYYFSSTTSMFAGMEGNLFKSLEIPAANMLDLEYGPPVDISIPEYKINYSSLSLRLGINFYF